MSTTSSALPLPPPPPPPVPRFDSVPPPSTSTPIHHQRTDSLSTTSNGTVPIQDALSRDFPEVASLS